ncbi:MAG TPA: MFS transporter [Candidatus Dormibacteraeota bacterium]|nr:MFS transporter [Candidatus Dormibacteraeota bacterium]
MSFRDGLAVARGTSAPRPVGPRYKWIALSNTTLGILMVTINASIVLISLPDIFRGIHLNPLAPGNTPYFLWLLMGYMVVTAVLVVTLGRVGDMYGRVRMYNLGFLVFTVFSILLSLSWMSGSGAALYLIVMRVLQGVGGAMLFANSSAILTDAFPTNQRGMALGTNMVAAIGGSFIGLVLGGVLGPIAWQLVFLVSVPVGLFGTIWAYLMLRDTGVRQPARIDWWGNLFFAVGLVAVLVGITYGILPYGHSSMGWGSPMVLTAMIGGVACLAFFTFLETKVKAPMFHIQLFRIRAFAMGNLAALLSSLARGGLMFILIIWLQGIWLPQHGYSFAKTPLWAGIYMLPLTAGFLVAGPIAGILSDRYGSRLFATLGVSVSALIFALFQVLPANFNYIWFAILLAVYGLSSGLFASPNQAGIMNSLPANQRGAGAGMAATFQNSAQVLSIGIFFTLIIVGLSASLPNTLFHGLVAQGVPAATATRISHLPAVGSLFASFLGYNPIGSLLGPVLPHLSHAEQAYLTGRAFFPHLISGPFMSGLHAAFDFALAACALAAVASWLRGGKYIHQEVAPGPVLAFASPTDGPAGLEPNLGLSGAASSSAEPQNRALQPAQTADPSRSGPGSPT